MSFKTYYKPSEDSKYTHTELCEMLLEIIEEAKNCGIKLKSIYPEVRYINSKHTLGMCTSFKNINKPCEIFISFAVLRGPKAFVRKLLAHEVCHATMNAVTHDYVWKSSVELMNKNYGYGITQYDDSGTTIIKSKYKLECSKCNEEIRYERICESVLNPEKYTCLKCNSKTLKAFILDKNNEYIPFSVAEKQKRERQRKIYFIYCVNCDFSDTYYRKCRVIKHIDRCMCPRCGGVLKVKVSGGVK